MNGNGKSGPYPHLLRSKSGEVRKQFHVLSLGAGVQSTTLYLLAMEGVTRCDVAIFADTQDEPEAVYRHLEWLKSLNGPPLLIRTKGRLGNDLLRGVNSTGQRFASIPAFTDGADTGMIRRQCSKEYKTEVVERAIRREVVGLEPKRALPRDVTVHQYIGISWDERARAVDVERRMKRGWTAIFPLIDRRWTRADCKHFLSSRVPHEVPKSACVYCPFHDDRQWQRLKDAGGPDWARVVQIDTALRIPGNIVNRNLDQKLYLHRSCKPITDVDFVNQNQESFGFMMECQGMCGV